MGETEEMGEKPSLVLGAEKGLYLGRVSTPPSFFQSSFEIATLLHSSPSSAPCPKLSPATQAMAAPGLPI